MDVLDHMQLINIRNIVQGSDKQTLREAENKVNEYILTDEELQDRFDQSWEQCMTMLGFRKKETADAT